jgi:tRNA nucleotidyltransferase (CCA-adding enzyme)
MKKMSFNFKKILEKIEFSDSEKLEIDRTVEEFKKKIKTKIFIGGSYAKKTMMKKPRVDIDVFVIFPYNEKNPSEKLKKILKKSRFKFTLIHGSRDYYQVDFRKINFELVPIVKINNSNEAKNITDVSPLHVHYILKKTKQNKKNNLAEEIMLAKSFCHACDCYGAESYISGFSGYALEVLVSYYGSFMKFVQEASKWKGKIIIDPEKYYKNKDQILNEINESKQMSPIILIDPVQKERNVCAALDENTFDKFIKNCGKLLKNPSESFFFKEKLNLEKIKKEAQKSKNEFIAIGSESTKNKIDVAGAKLKKAYDFLLFNLDKNGFSVKKGFFDFDEKKLDAKFYLIVKNPEKSQIIFGPPLKAAKKHLDAFKKKWKKTFVSKGRLCSKTERKFSQVGDLLKNRPFMQQLKTMAIKEMRVLI